MLNNILISRETRKVLSKDNRFIGIEGENLQEILVFNLDEKLDGQGIIEVQFMDKTKGFIEVEKTERGYELPVKSSLLTQRGSIEMQLRIIQEGQEIFKSEITTFLINEAINATTTIPEQYPTGIDNLEALKLNLENAEKERVEAEQNRADAEKARVETFNQMGQAVDNAIGNIVDLQEAYDKNAEEKIKDFDTHVVTQTENINKHVQDKITEFDEHTEELTNRLDGIDEKDTNQDKLIEDLQTQIINLETENEMIKNQFPTGEAEGENITLEDSADMEFKELRIGGNSWQETRSGKNILPNTNTTKTMNGVTFTINADGSITVNGTNEGEKIAYQVRSNISLKPNTKYTFSGCSNGSNSTYLMQIALNTNGSKNYHSTSINPVTFEVVGETTAEVYIVIFKNATVNNVTFYPQLEEGTVATDYEPYGAMPSPEFPSPIRNVGENVNEFDGEIESGWISMENGELSSNANRTRFKNFNKVDGGKSYHLSSKGVTSSENWWVYFYDENKQFISYISATQMTSNKNIFKTPDNCKYVKGCIAVLSETITEVMLKKGSKATPYSPYNCGNFNETVCNENLFDEITELGTINATTGGNISYSDGIRGKNYCKCKPNTTYYVYCGTTVNSLGLVFYDSNKTFITTKYGVNTTITAPINAEYFRIRLDGYGTTYNNDILVAEGSEPKEYIPHQSQQFTFPLKPGQRMYKDSYLADDGVHHKRGQTVFDGTETWNKSAYATDISFVAWLDLRVIKGGESEGLTNIGPVDYINYIGDYKSGAFYNVGGTSAFLKIENTAIPNWDNNLTDAEKLELFKSYLAEQYANGTPIIFEYILAEEIVEPYTEEQQLVYNEIKKAHSYKNVTHIFSTDEIKPQIEVVYRKDWETINQKQEDRILALENAVLGGN